MARSPDLSALVDLRPYDLTPWDITNRALLKSKELFAGDYDPLVMDPEVVLVEALAREVMDLVIAANRSVWASVHGVLNAFGVSWNRGAKATARVTFTGTNGTTIPVGAQCYLRLSTGEKLSFSVTQAGTISGGLVDLPVQCTVFTSLANRLATATPLTMAVSTPSVLSAIVSTAVTGGLDPETMDDYYARVSNRLARITDSLTLTDHFRQAALEFPFVARAMAIDLWDGISGTTRGGDINCVTVLVSGSSGVPVSSDNKAILLADLVARSLASLRVKLKDAGLVPVAVTATVRAMPGADLNLVEERCMAVLADMINADTWSWGGTLMPNDIIEALGRDVMGADVVIGAITPVDPVTCPDTSVLYFDAANSVITVEPAP